MKKLIVLITPLLFACSAQHEHSQFATNEAVQKALTEMSTRVQSLAMGLLVTDKRLENAKIKPATEEEVKAIIEAAKAKK